MEDEIKKSDKCSRNLILKEKYDRELIKTDADEQKPNTAGKICTELI